jgi:retron-type reverse transcriptase
MWRPEPRKAHRISPLLANVALHILDEEWQKAGWRLGVLVRYADLSRILDKSAYPDDGIIPSAWLKGLRWREICSLGSE